MFEIFADTRRLRVCKKEKITTTSAGINCLVKFSTDYVGHAIKLVFQINGKRWTVETQYNADGSTIRIPNDCFLPTTSPAWSPLNCELTCALRGEYIVEGGTTVTSRLPTVFTSMGIVEQGYDDAGAMTETAPTPTQVTQLETLVANCLSSAQMYTNMASSSATSAATSAALAANYTRRLSNMTVNAVGTSAGSTPTVTVSIVGSAYNFKFGIPKGETGATGPQGPAGADGRDGVDGADGIQGPQGPMGPAGRDGRDGTDGTNGRDGVDGQDGRDGVDGATGPQGPAGPTGPTGPEGPQGPQGPQGPEGPVKVTYHFVYGTIPSGASNPTLAEVDEWLRDTNQIHVMRYKATGSEVYKDFLYNYSNSSYHYFGGSNGLTKSYGCRIRRTGDTAGQWSSSGATLAQEDDVLLNTANNFLVRFNSADSTDRTSLADIEAAFSAGKNLILDFHVDVGSSGICDGITGHLRYTDDLFYWYFVHATNGTRYVTLRRTGTTAGTWSTSGVTMQNSAYRTNEVAANATSSDYYPTCKGVANYVTAKTPFMVTYGTTTFSEITDAHNAGRECCLVYNAHSMTLQFINATSATFVGLHSNGAIYYAGVNSSNTWTSDSRYLTLWNEDTETTLTDTANKIPRSSAVVAYAEPTSNKSTSIDESSDTKYPTTKAVADYVDSKKDFRAYYDTTTWSEVNEAHSAVKDIYVYRNNLKHRLQYVYTLNNHNAYVFGLFYNGQWSRLTVNTDAEGSTTTWSSGSMNLQDVNYRKSTILGNESSTATYPNCKAVADYINELTTATVGNNETVIIPANKGYNVTILSGCSACTFNLQYNIYRRDAVVLIKALNDVNSLNFTTETGRTIVWASGTAPSIVSGHTYELSFRCFNSKVMCVWKDWGL